MTPEEIELRFKLVDAKIALANHHVGVLASYMNMIIREMAQVDRGLALASLSAMANNTEGAVTQIQEARVSLQTVTDDLAEMMSHFQAPDNAEG